MENPIKYDVKLTRISLRQAAKVLKWDKEKLTYYLRKDDSDLPYEKIAGHPVFIKELLTEWKRNKIDLRTKRGRELKNNG